MAGNEKFTKKAGVAETKIFPHNLRHLFTRSYYEDTKDLAGLADLLGHSSVNVTRIYTSTTESVFLCCRQGRFCEVYLTLRKRRCEIRLFII